jgi:hypothetical protein
LSVYDWIFSYVTDGSGARQLLIEKGIITEEKLFETLKQVKGVMRGEERLGGADRIQGWCL